MRSRFEALAQGLLLLAGFVGAGFSYAGAVLAGTSWDAPFDTRAAEAFLNLPADLTLREAYEYIPQISEYYGVLFFQFLGVIRGIARQPDFLTSENPAAYLWQGIANTTLALACMLIFSIAIGYALRSTLVASATWATVMTLPLWVGMSHVNFKDMPVACGLAVLSAGLLFANRRNQTGHRAIMLLALTLIALGSFLAIGTRVGAIVLVLVLSGLTCMWWLLLGLRRRNLVQSLETTLLVVLGLGIAVMLLWLTNPLAQINPAGLIIDSIRVSGSFPVDFAVRVAGADVATTNVPPWYVPAWVAAQMPLALWVWLLTILVLLARAIKNRQLSRLVDGGNYMAPILIQAFVVPLAIVVSGATLYDGIRHLLFAVPALIAVLVALLCGLMTSARGGTQARTALVVFLLAGVTLNVFAVIRWFPYSYAYVNPIAGARAPQQDWELDYWGVSTREGVERLQAKGARQVMVLPNADMAIPYGGVNFDSQRTAEDKPMGVYVFTRFGAELPNEQQCTDTFTIERDRQILGRGGLCPTGP